MFVTFKVKNKAEAKAIVNRCGKEGEYKYYKYFSYLVIGSTQELILELVV